MPTPRRPRRRFIQSAVSAAGAASTSAASALSLPATLSGRKLQEDYGLIPETSRLKPIGIAHHGGVTESLWREKTAEYGSR